MRRRILFAAAAVLALAITSGCETAKNPATDTTPPDVDLKGHNNSSTATVTQQVGPVSSNYTTLVKLTFDAHGSDTGGVRKISITGKGPDGQELPVIERVFIVNNQDGKAPQSTSSSVASSTTRATVAPATSTTG